MAGAVRHSVGELVPNAFLAEPPNHFVALDGEVRGLQVAILRWVPLGGQLRGNVREGGIRSPDFGRDAPRASSFACRCDGALPLVMLRVLETAPPVEGSIVHLKSVKVYMIDVRPKGFRSGDHINELSSVNGVVNVNVFRGQEDRWRSVTNTKRLCRV